MVRLHPLLVGLYFSCQAAGAPAALGAAGDGPWQLHAIEAGAGGADGARLDDFNGDSRPDIVTGWEEGGRVRLYLHPEPRNVREPWPAVTAGRVASPEDAVITDFTGHGALRIISSCEGGTRAMFLHAPPRDPRQLLDETAWTTAAIPAAAGRERWMFATPDRPPFAPAGKAVRHLVAGSKGGNGSVSLLTWPGSADKLEGWRLTRIRAAGWIMSIERHDFDGDGAKDILISDRFGPRRGVHWLRHPGPGRDITKAEWQNHVIGATTEEVMFIDLADVNGDGRLDVVAPVKPRGLWIFEQPRTATESWPGRRLELPGPIGTGKSARVADLDGDGRLDLVLSCEHATPPLEGVAWYSFSDDHLRGEPRFHRLGGPAGIKFDLLQLIDLSGDGRLDVLTCEERDDLGVIWYENPF